LSCFLNFAPHLAFLIWEGVIAQPAADCHALPSRMNVIPMAAFAATIHESGLFQVGNQLSQFARHFSIKIVSQAVPVVKPQLLQAQRRFAHGNH
jgi:hypothetical protein